MAKFSEAQEEALRLADKGVCTSAICEKSDTDVFGNPIPGVAVFRKLIKAGYIFETEEEPLELDDGTLFDFTPSYHLTEEGEAALAELRGSGPSM